MDTWGKNILGRKKNKTNGHEEGVRMVCPTVPAGVWREVGNMRLTGCCQVLLRAGFCLGNTGASGRLGAEQ